MAITNYLVHFTTETTYNNKKSELRNDAVAFVKDATIIHTHGTDYYCGSGPVALKSDLSGYATTSALTSGLAGKANTSHTHTIAQVSGLQTELDSKLESADLSGYALKTDIPSLSGGASATSGQYVSGVTVSGHKITVTKATLPVTTLSSLGITATAAELNYCDGVTSNIQTQLNGKAASSHTHTASQVSGLATVATSGSYDDLTDKPSIPSLSGYATQSWVEDQGYLTSVPAQSWSSITGKPSTFTPATHTHSADDITSGTLAIARIPTGTTSSTVALGNHTHSNYLPLSGGTLTGNLTIANKYTISDFLDILKISLPGGQSIELGNGETYPDLDLYGSGDNRTRVLTSSNYSEYVKPSSIGAAASSHTHSIANITNLQTTLDGCVKYTSNKDGIDSITNKLSFPNGDLVAQDQSNITYAGKRVSFEGHTHSAATTSAAGFMSAADKSKLDGITANADSVSVSRNLTSGTQIASITINGTATALYAPTNTDTRNTTGTSNSTSKLYLAGGTSQSAGGVITYSNSNVYTRSGQLYATQMNAANGFYETSDARLKNFKDDIKALDTVDQIPTKYFTWKEDENQESQIGTSAQEVEKLYPELVSKIEDDTLTVDYAKLSIIALAAIKELKAEIQSLKEEIKQLKSK